MLKIFVLLSMAALYAFCYFTNVNSYRYEAEVMDLLGLSHHFRPIKQQPSLRNSASKFLFDAYKVSREYEEQFAETNKRPKRSLRNDFTAFHQLAMKRSTNIITFSSKTSKPSGTSNIMSTGMEISFNTNDVPHDLQLLHSALRIYQDPSQGLYQYSAVANTSISIYGKIYSQIHNTNVFKILGTINATTMHKGWIEFNVTRLLSEWLYHTSRDNEIRVVSTIHTASELANSYSTYITATDLGLITAKSKFEELKPFLIGYFNRPQIMDTIRKLRIKRQVNKRKQNTNLHRPQKVLLEEEYKQPEICQRVNLTLDFRDLPLYNSIIAPKQFEANFCGGGCNFPLGSKMNSTNHAIVQTLMHLRQPNLPKACCVPTKLGSFSILYYLNDDTVNLIKFAQSVAMECGCH